MRQIARTAPALLLAGSFSLATLPAQAQFATGTDYMSAFAIEPVDESVYTFRWGAYRSLFIVTDEGVIVTDPINPRAAAVFREEIRKLTDQPVRYVVYSHSHWDRAAGGQVFKDEGAVIVAQRRCEDDFEMSPHPDIVAPDITFDERATLRLGDQALDLHYYGPSVSNCLIAMVVRPAKLLYLVSLVQPPTGWEQPWDVNLANHHIYNLVPYLRSVEDLVAGEGIDTMVGGFIALGADASGKRVLLPPAGPAAAVRERRQFWEQFMAAVKLQHDKGVWSELVPDKMDFTPFAQISGFDEEGLKIVAWRIAHYYYSGR